MSETLFYNPKTTIATDTIATGNISVNLDLLDQWLYLRPSVSNAATIVAGMMRFGNTYGQSAFGTNVFSTLGMSYANTYGTMANQTIYGTIYMPGGYVFQTAGNGNNQSAVFSAKENTITNYVISGTGFNGTFGGCLLPDGRALILITGTAVNSIWLWNNITRTSSTITIPTGQNVGYAGACQTADGNIAITPSSKSNIVLLNTTTFTLSNVYNFAPKSFGLGCSLDVTGNVIVSPTNATSGIGVWNPAAGTLHSVPATGVTDLVRWSAVAGDGRIIFDPATFNFIPTYNPLTLTYTSYTAPWAAGTLRFGCGKTLPDGRVLFLQAYGGTFCAIFNHQTNTATTFIYPVISPNLSIIGGIFVPDGRFICANTTGISNVPIITSLCRTAVPEAWCLHPFFNKCR